MNRHPISQANKREQQTQQQWMQQVAGNPRWERITNKTPQDRERRLQNSGRTTAQRRQTLSTKHRGCKEAATKYYNYTANKADEEREHRLPMFQENAVNRTRTETDEESTRGKFTVKIIRSSMQR